MKKIIFASVFSFMALAASAQDGYRDSNRIGISGGINQFTLDTDNFEASPGMGWNAGLSVRGNFYNDFDMVYGMQFSENVFTVKGVSPTNIKDIKYKLDSAQISLLLSYKVIENHLSFELGPMIQVNGKLNVAEEDEAYIINSNGVTAKDIQEISTFNFYPTVGVTAGVRHVRLNIMYQYGVNNILGKLDDSALGEDFKGHAGILTGCIILYL
ncbi:MAG TPA: outer membrane beta-barrel protein [Flavobacterium sp.]|nr:outer membrane beta-barrel protein [Flavobacterium sp.]